MKIIVVTGTHRDTRRGHAREYLDAAQPDAVIAGGAAGIDTEAREWAREHGVYLIEVPAPWKPKEPRADGRRYDPSAGHRRNTLMVSIAAAMKADGHEVTGVAFPDRWSKGTHDCARKLKAAGIVVDERPYLFRHLLELPAFREEEDP